jgi:beta-lactamase class D
MIHLKTLNKIVKPILITLIGLIVLFLLLFQTIQPASTTPASSINPSVTVNIPKNIDFEKHFRELNVEGSIIIYDLNHNQFFQHNPQRNKTPFPVASTFKIPNSLISLETGVIKDELAILTWDGITREIPTWNRDLNLKEAFQISAVWFYQVLARRVDYDQMQQWITKVGYGNQNIGNKDEIDQFWLNGSLQITPQQQIEFLTRLYQNDLPFSEKNISIVKDIMISEKTPEYTIRAKTGWFGFGNKSIPNIGWYVGYLETADNVYFFATNIDIRNEQDGSSRIKLTRLCLKDLGLL